MSAAELESLIAIDPNDLIARLRLIGRYGNMLLDRESQERRNRHIIWLAEHHPEIGGLDINPDLFPNAYAEGRLLWLEAALQNRNDPIVLENVVSFLSAADVDTALTIALRGRALEPERAEWNLSLGFLYRYQWYGSNSADERQSTGLAAMRAIARALTISGTKSEHCVLIDYGKAAIMAHCFDSAARVAEDILKATQELDINDHLRRQGEHFCHVIIGHFALARGNLNAATLRLSAAAAAEARFASGLIFGPDLTLACALLQLGARDVVAGYLEALKSQWSPRLPIIEAWVAQVRAGQPVEFRIGGQSVSWDLDEE